MTAADEALRGARRVLCLAIGGGGDVVGALAAAAHAEALGVPAEVGGLTWERRPIDPLPGPRRIAELDDAEVLHPFAALAGPRTAGPGGFRFAESRMAGLLGRPVALVDPNGGPHGAAGWIAAAAPQLEAGGLRTLGVVFGAGCDGELTPDGGRLHWFAPEAALRSAAHLAAAVRGTRDLEDADAILSARGVRTDLAYERDAGA
jgi:hypothetical protein